MGLRKTRSPSRADRRKRVRQRRILSLVLLGLVILSSPLWSSLFMRLAAGELAGIFDDRGIRKISIDGLSVLTADSVHALCDLPVGVPAFEPDFEMIRKQIEGHPWIASVTIERQLPDHLRISVTERQPAATIRCQEVYVLSDEGIVLPAPAREWVWEMPMVTCTPSTRLEIGRRLDDPAAIDLLDHVKRARRAAPRQWKNISEIYTRNGETWATLLDPPIALRIGTHVEARAWQALDVLLSHTRSDARIQRGDTVDMRIPGSIVVQTASRSKTKNTERDDA